MALELTKEQEAALIAVADRELAKPKAKSDYEAAKTAYESVYQQWMAAREVEQIRTNEAMSQINLDWQPALAAAKAALELAEKALSDTTAVSVGG